MSAGPWGPGAASAPAEPSAGAPSARGRNLFHNFLALSMLAGALCLFTATPVRAQAIVATDRAALEALYNATGGANWTNNTNWLSDSAPGTWHGVFTFGGRVTGLSLENNNLTGSIPAALGNLANVSFLYLWSNKLTGKIPAELGNMTSLEWLYLNNNQLSGKIPAELGNLPALKLLSLSSNKLTGKIPAALGNLTNLQELYLSRNQLTGKIPTELGNLTNLLQLSLWGNKLTGKIPTELGNLPALRFLYLSQNQLSGEIPAELGNPPDLQELYLNQNQLSGEIPAELGNPPNLTKLYLNQNQLTGGIPAALGNLVWLTELYLYQNQLSGPIPAATGQWRRLRELVLWGNPLLGDIPSALYTAVNRGALALFYRQADGTNWTNNTNWESFSEIDSDLSTWHGVTVDSDGQVTQLNLPNNGLKGSVTPNGLPGLPELQRLDLSGNAELKGQLQQDLRHSKLTFLDVSGTGLCAPWDSAFQTWLASITYRGATCPSPRPPAPPPPPPAPPQPPGPPRDLTAVSGDGEVVLSWRKPWSSGRAAITDYEYRYWTGSGAGAWTSIGSTATTHTVTGLDNGAAYTFRVRAVNRVGKSNSSNRVEVNVGAVLDLTHFASGGGITSELVFLNVSPQLTRPALYFYDQGGELMDPASVVEVAGDLMVAEDGSLTVHAEMEPLDQLTIATHGRGQLLSGSVRVVSGFPIGGLARYSVPSVGVAAVAASPPVRDVVFPARRQEGGVRTAAALHNLEEEVLGVNCRLMSGGVALEEVEIPLEANGQASWYIEEAFSATDTSDFLGSVRCTVPVFRRVTAIAVETDAAQRTFTPLPVVPVDRTGGIQGETVLDFAHFANGTWITDLVLLNLSIEPSGPPISPFHTAILPSRPAIYFHDTEGNPIAPASVVDITGDLEVTEDGALTLRTEMDPLGVVTISTHGRGDLVTGSVRVVSDGPIGGMLRFDHPSFGVAGAATSPPLSEVIFPVRRQQGGINTGVALHNLESSSGLLRCELLREGLLLDSVSIPLEANAQTSWTIDAAFPGTDTSDFSGLLRCTAPAGDLFTAVALEMDSGTRTFFTVPAFPVPELPSRE